MGYERSLAFLGMPEEKWDTPGSEGCHPVAGPSAWKEEFSPVFAV